MREFEISARSILNPIGKFFKILGILLLVALVCLLVTATGYILIYETYYSWSVAWFVAKVIGGIVGGLTAFVVVGCWIEGIYLENPTIKFGKRKPPKARVVKR